MKRRLLGRAAHLGEGELGVRDGEGGVLEEEGAEGLDARLERVAAPPHLDRLPLLQVRQRLPPAPSPGRMRALQTRLYVRLPYQVQYTSWWPANRVSVCMHACMAAQGM